jgi:hypothetical protein
MALLSSKMPPSMRSTSTTERRFELEPEFAIFIIGSAGVGSDSDFEVLPSRVEV